jgi:hypothetical protein
MTGLIRCRRISRISAEIRHCAPVTAIAAAVAASFAVFAFGGAGLFAPSGAAFAQSPGTAGSVTINDLFTGDEVELNRDAAQKLADAARKAQAPGECPLGRLTVNTPAGDPLFQHALGQARRVAVLAFLDREGIKASRFFADVTIGGTQNNARLDYNVARDDIAPTLDVRWTPPKGAKVKARKEITADVSARDDANRWQTGIKTIDLNVQGGGRFGAGAYPQPPQTCERAPPAQTLAGAYAVPDNPPPLVRLLAVAKDYAGNETETWADFPTGDWYGSVTWTETLLNVPSRAPTRFWGRLEFAADYDRRGNLTGKVVSTENFEGSETGGDRCDVKSTKPTILEVSLTGSYTPGTNTMSLFVDPKTVKHVFGEVGYSCNSPPHQLGRLDPVIRPELNEIMRNLGLVNDDHATVIRDWNPASNGIGALHMELSLHRARN